tara:strand:- start:95 stop:850 length:756 start_codon:yes stop_codon:yes gene_type:complete
MKIGVFMWYDGNVAQYGDICWAINQLYCEKHGYTLTKSNKRTYKDRPPTWERFPLLLNHIENFDYVMWIDADAFFYNCAPPLEDLINHYEKDILLSMDVEAHLTPENINAGVFILKNTKQVINILSRWVNDKELADRFMSETGPEIGWWLEDQAMIRGSLRYNIDGMQEITEVLPYMELQHFNLYEYPILKKHNILPYVFHSAGKGSVTRYHIAKSYLQEIRGNPLSPFSYDNLRDKPLHRLNFSQGEQKI